MAEIRLLKVGSLGIPTEFADSDQITLASFSVTGSGPSLSATGLDNAAQSIEDVSKVLFVDASTSVINQTAGDLIIDDIMAKDRDNIMGASGAVLFPNITDAVDKVDSFGVPYLSGIPSAVPSNAQPGLMVYDSSGKDMYVWDGSAWDNMNTVEQSEGVVGFYFAVSGCAISDALYLTPTANYVDKARANADATAQLIGFAAASAPTGGGLVEVRLVGTAVGFSGLTPGARYYLSAAVAGAITPTLPTGSGHTLEKAGIARSATSLQIMIQDLGKRN